MHARDLALEQRAQRTLRRLLLAAPPLLVGLLIYAYGVDVPALDQWNAICPLFEKWEAGTLRLADFYALHNEHRIFFPRAISFGIGLLTGWNVRAELFAIGAMAGISGFNLWRLARATGWGDSTRGRWLLVAANALLFTPLQYENWLLGIQIVVFLPVVCTTACAWIATLPQPRVRFVGTAVLAAVSSFSMASGFLCWPLTFLLLIHRDGRIVWRGQRAWYTLWLSSFALSIALYVRGYHKPPDHPAVWEFAQNPLSAAQYLLTYLGSCFGSGTALNAAVVAATAGSVLLVLLAGCLVYLWRGRADRELCARALPWLVPAGFAIGNAALTTFGRLGFGVDQALMSRYVTFSIWLPIALVFLVPLIFEHAQNRAPSRRANAPIGAALIAAAASLALLHLLASLTAAPIWGDQKRIRLIAKALVELIDVVDEPKALRRYVHPDVAPLRARALALDRLGFVRPGLVHSHSIAEIADPLAPGSAAYGEVQHSGWTGSGRWGALGWAVLPDARRPADAVVITVDDPAGAPIIAALAEIGMARSDVAAAQGEPAYVRSGWIEEFDPKRLPEGAILKMWAFDALRGRAYRIAGEAIFQR